ncbi:uncharacterized protein LOC120704981 [Panicum virgatum]|uniref:Late embryogenesis abundant protein LEA-2 subgroup domain-containing protein n=1 Tax=Panicum virgatum TaxID=38727 RepID=A0A8T0TDH0_PANVG|nr:uncharacterized protein LOC120704981 [Panicum virgatum]KAG2609030.1 hypothetical protein PVAP13_4KG054800 [Panicum virgatum]
MAPPAPAAAAGQMALKAKRFVLGALAATLAVAVVVTVSSVVLRPARLQLRVTRARYSRGKSSSSSQDGGGVVELLLTLAANNTSERAAVRYESMFVDLTNSTAVVRAESMAFVTANLTTTLPLCQRRRSVADFSATLLLVPGIWTDSSGDLTTNRFAVVVTATARFKVGIARTRLFDIKLACRPVRFVLVDEAAAKQSGGAPDGPPPPVDCVPI